MRRAVLALVATAIGLVLLSTFRTRQIPDTTSREVAVAGPVSAPPPTVATTAPRRVTQVVVGRPYSFVWGVVQVQVELAGTRIVQVDPVVLPHGNVRNAEISNFAVPVLSERVLDAQSADVDTVTGATYTSQGYLRSLQSALDRAALQRQGAAPSAPAGTATGPAQLS